MDAELRTADRTYAGRKNKHFMQARLMYYHVLGLQHVPGLQVLDRYRSFAAKTASSSISNINSNSIIIK